jgi:hypothetical protein
MRTNPAGLVTTRSALSRRKLGLGAIGTTLIASAPATADERRVRARPLQWSFAPVPIPTASPYHVSGPNAANPNAEPSVITNFNGQIGFATLSGMVTRTNIKTGEQQTLPFTKNTNLRFMTGTFVGTDGQSHAGTFALI